MYIMNRVCKSVELFEPETESKEQKILKTIRLVLELDQRSMYNMV